MFIDETWAKTNMAPLRGWAPRGRRFVAKVPHRRWKTTTFVAALRLDRIAAPWLISALFGPEYEGAVGQLRLLLGAVQQGRDR